MTRTLRDALNDSNPNQLPAAGHDALLGDVLALVPVFHKSTTPGEILLLPDDRKAAQVLRCFVTDPTALRYLTPADPETTPGAGNVAVTPTGDIVFAAADNVAAVEVLYQPVEGQLFEEVIQVAASLGAPLQGRSAVVLLEAEILTGLVGGGDATPTVILRDSATTSGAVSIDRTGLVFTFHADDVVTGTVRVKYLAAPGVGAGVRAALRDRLDAAVNY